MGGLIARGVVQSCPLVKVSVLIGLGTPQMGVARVPNHDKSLMQRILDKFANTFIYSKCV